VQLRDFVVAAVVWAASLPAKVFLVGYERALGSDQGRPRSNKKI
jgi:hypothetical protein